VLIEVENLLARSAVELGVVANVLVESLQVGEALLLGNDQHLRVEIGNLLEPHLVNLLGLKIGGRHLADGELVAGVAVGQ
jgi:hypothetical protein